MTVTGEVRSGQRFVAIDDLPSRITYAARRESARLSRFWKSWTVGPSLKNKAIRGGAARLAAHHVDTNDAHDRILHGIENYRANVRRLPGEAPPTFARLFSGDYLLFIDESHQTVPQPPRSITATLAQADARELRFPHALALDNRR